MKPPLARFNVDKSKSMTVDSDGKNDQCGAECGTRTHDNDMSDLIAAFEASKSPVEKFPKATDVPRAYASCGRMAEALYLQARLVEQTSRKTSSYVHRLLVSVILLILNLRFREACAVLLPILHRLPQPLTRHDGLFLMAYIDARQGISSKRAALLWLKCLGPTWPDQVNQPHAWNESGRKWLAAGLTDIAAWMFAEGMPSSHSALHVVPMPAPSPHGATVELFVRSMLLSTLPNRAHIDDVLTTAMKCADVKYNAGIRSLCVALEREDLTTAFSAQDAATRTIVRAFRTVVTWRRHRPLYWMEVAVRGFQTYKRPRRVKKSRTKKTFVEVVQVQPNDPPPVPEVPTDVENGAPMDPPSDDLLAMYGDSTTPSDGGDFESRLRFILHRAKVIADKTTAAAALTMDSVTPQWLKQLHAVRDTVRSDVYMTQWKAGVLRNMGAAVALMEAANGPTDCSRYGRVLLKDIDLCRVRNVQARMDQLLRLAMAEESRRNLAYFHLVHQSQGAAT